VVQHTIIIQLTVFYYLVINYNYILIDNEICKNVLVTSSVVKYTMQTIQNPLHAVLTKFTILCHTHKECNFQQTFILQLNMPVFSILLQM
jgi:hypothetical protein